MSTIQYSTPSQAVTQIQGTGEYLKITSEPAQIIGGVVTFDSTGLECSIIVNDDVMTQTPLVKNLNNTTSLEYLYSQNIVTSIDSTSSGYLSILPSIDGGILSFSNACFASFLMYNDQLSSRIIGNQFFLGLNLFNTTPDYIQGTKITPLGDYVQIATTTKPIVISCQLANIKSFLLPGATSPEGELFLIKFSLRDVDTSETIGTINTYMNIGGDYYSNSGVVCQATIKPQQTKKIGLYCNEILGPADYKYDLFSGNTTPSFSCQIIEIN